MIQYVETKYKKGDTIYWYCNTDDEVLTWSVQFVNHIPLVSGNNYEETICCVKEDALYRRR